MKMYVEVNGCFFSKKICYYILTANFILNSFHNPSLKMSKMKMCGKSELIKDGVVKVDVSSIGTKFENFVQAGCRDLGSHRSRNVYCRKPIILPNLVLFFGTFLKLPVLPSITCAWLAKCVEALFLLYQNFRVFKHNRDGKLFANVYIQGVGTESCSYRAFLCEPPFRTCK